MGRHSRRNNATHLQLHRERPRHAGHRTVNRPLRGHEEELPVALHIHTTVLGVGGGEEGCGFCLADGSCHSLAVFLEGGLPCEGGVVVDVLV